MIYLFWQIGDEIKQFKANAKKQGPEIALPAISAALQKRFGKNFFSSAQLRQMEQFADVFTDPDDINTISYLLTWKQILLLLKISEPKSRTHYIKLAIQNAHGARQVRAKMPMDGRVGGGSARANHSAVKNSKALPSKHILDGLSRFDKELLSPGHNMDRIFRDPLFLRVRSLSGRKNSPGSKSHLKANKAHQHPINIFIEQVAERIDQFHQQLNFRINGQLNLLLWELGKFLNEQNTTPSPDRNKRTENERAVLPGSNFTSLFSRQQLADISSFASQIPDLGIATWIAHALSWDHIRSLLPLQNPDAIIFYTDLALKNKLNARALKKAVQTKADAPVSFKAAIDKKLLNALQQPTRETSVKKSNQSTETITYLNYEFSNIDSLSSSIDFLKNPWFSKLLKYHPRS